MSELELDQDPGSECSKDSEENDKDDAGNETNNGQGGRKGEHAIANNLAYHEHADHWPAQRLISDCDICLVTKDILFWTFQSGHGGWSVLERPSYHDNEKDQQRKPRHYRHYGHCQRVRDCSSGTSRS